MRDIFEFVRMVENYFGQRLTNPSAPGQKQILDAAARLRAAYDEGRLDGRQGVPDRGEAGRGGDGVSEEKSGQVRVDDSGATQLTVLMFDVPHRMVAEVGDKIITHNGAVLGVVPKGMKTTKESTPIFFGPNDRAGERWDRDEDSKLRKLWNVGYGIKDLAKIHGRTPGAIVSRLMKLGYDMTSYQHIV